MRFQTIFTLAVSVLSSSAAKNATKAAKAPAAKGKASTTPHNPTIDEYLQEAHDVANPLLVANLVAKDIVNYNVADLDSSEKDVEKAFEKFWSGAGSMLQHRVQNAIEGKPNPSEVDDLKAEIHLFIDALAKVENLDNKVMAKLDQIYKSHPEYATYTRMLVQPDGEPYFEKEMLESIDLFFTIANDYNPEITDKLVDILNISEKKYHVVPDSFYKKVQMAYAGKSPK